MQWMIYGATGYTGQLVIESALARGHRPVLAGRNADKLVDLANRYDLETVAFDLSDEGRIGEAIGDMDIVYHAAGPFTYTAEPMIRACLATHTHYVDITGEINVFEMVFRYDEAARKNGIALITGAGFDVVPTDCLAAYVASQVRGATTLEIGIRALSEMSAGTAKSMVEMMPRGGMVRRQGHIVSRPIDESVRMISLPSGRYRGMSIPWGDVATAYHTTGIPNITSYMVMPTAVIISSRLFSPIMQFMFKSEAIRQTASDMIERRVIGPDEHTRQTAMTEIWACATNASGQSVEAWLTTLEGYQFTAEVAPLVIERLAELQPIGAMTPALAFGADFVLDVPQTERYDTL